MEQGTNSWTFSSASFLSEETRNRLKETKLVVYRSKPGTHHVKIYKGDGPIKSRIVPIRELRQELKTLENLGYLCERYRGGFVMTRRSCSGMIYYLHRALLRVFRKEKIFNFHFFDNYF